MRFGRRQLEVENRVQERREREDNAPRLRDQVAKLAKLSIEIDDHYGATMMASTRYTRHVVVDRAPALFQIPCSEPSCEDGGHDVTTEIMRALRSGQVEFSGKDVCFGWRGGERCECVLHFVGHATYSADRVQPADS